MLNRRVAIVALLLLLFACARTEEPLPANPPTLLTPYRPDQVGTTGPHDPRKERPIWGWVVIRWGDFTPEYVNVKDLDRAPQLVKGSVCARDRVGFTLAEVLVDSSGEIRAIRSVDLDPAIRGAVQEGALSWLVRPGILAGKPVATHAVLRVPVSQCPPN